MSQDKPKCHILIEVDDVVKRCEIRGSVKSVLATLLGTAERVILTEVERNHMSKNAAAMMGLRFAAEIGRKAEGDYVQ